MTVASPRPRSAPRDGLARRRPRGALLLLAAVLLAALGLATAGAAQDPCLECHGVLGLGLEGRPLWVHREVFENGVHGRLACSDCHKGYDAFPHRGPRENRCDLPCHVAGASHEEIAAAEAPGVHAGVASPGCAACHGGGAAPRGREVDDRCRGCHGALEPSDAVFPAGPGAFGRRAHASARDSARVPGCVACHGAHGIGAGEDARRNCGQSPCHPGSGEQFSRLFSHGREGAPEPWGAAGPVALALGGLLAGFLLLHSVRAKP